MSYADMVISELADSEAALLARVASLEQDVEIYKLLVRTMMDRLSFYARLVQSDDGVRRLRRVLHDEQDFRLELTKNIAVPDEQVAA